jgi:hypothetical protein
MEKPSCKGKKVHCLLKIYISLSPDREKNFIMKLLHFSMIFSCFVTSVLFVLLDKTMQKEGGRYSESREFRRSQPQLLYG